MYLHTSKPPRFNSKKSPENIKDFMMDITVLYCLLAQGIVQGYEQLF